MVRNIKVLPFSPVTETMTDTVIVTPLSRDRVTVICRVTETFEGYLFRAIMFQ